MVWPTVGAACIGGTATAGATALGLGIDKSNLDLTRECFLMQMRQAKRLFTAQWAEASYRHGEQILQAARHHTEAQAMAKACYYQAEKIASQSYKLARDQDSRAYEMTWRTEARESLRDELMNQFNRFNIIMLCDTVCLGCVYALVVEGAPPLGTSQLLLKLYLSCMGASIALFSISLWCSVIVVRRLHEHTASVLERKLFAQNRDLQKVWEDQLESNLPTGPYVMNLVNEGYQQWVREYIHPLGNASIQMLSVGVVGMFFCAGFLTHTRYIVDYNAPEAVYTFWLFVTITSMSIIYMKIREDGKERRKQGIYDNSWQDSPHTNGPFAKITRAADELFTNTAIRLGSFQRTKDYGERERLEREYVVDSQPLNYLSQKLQKESACRAKIRNDVIQVLTSAAEELEALPEDLITSLNKIICDVNEADNTTGQYVSTPGKDFDNNNKCWDDKSQGGSGGSTIPTVMAEMNTKPFDAQRTPVLLGALRMKLGEISLTTLIRIRNLSNEPLRLISGVHLEQGRYIKDLEVMIPRGSSDNGGNSGGASHRVLYHLYPNMEIPPRTEVVIAARSCGANWFPTSGIEGELAFASKDESWEFRVQFRNQLNRNGRTCEVQATQVFEHWEANNNNNEHWMISKDILDYKNNNEVLVFIDKGQHGQQQQQQQLHPTGTTQTALDMHQLSLKTGFLLEFHSFGVWVQWQRRYVSLTPSEIVLPPDPATKEEIRIPTRDITRVRIVETDLEQQNVFDVYSNDRKPLRLAATSPEERDEWIEKILLASGRVVKVLMAGDNSSNRSQTGELNNNNFHDEHDVNDSSNRSTKSLSQSQTELLPELHDLSSLADDSSVLKNNNMDQHQPTVSLIRDNVESPPVAFIQPLPNISRNEDELPPLPPPSQDIDLLQAGDTEPSQPTNKAPTNSSAKDNELSMRDMAALWKEIESLPV